MMISSSDSEMAHGMAEIAREAGALLLSYFEQGIGYEYKGHVDLVTEADRKSEALIRGRIRSRWPGHDIIGEEGTRIESGSDFCWYVDPLDGTTNFAHGFPIFCVSLALYRKRRPAAAAIYDPTRNEMFLAEAGRGATLNGKPIGVSDVKRLGECLVVTGYPSHKRHKNPNIYFYHQIAMRTHAVRRTGSAALDLCYVAAGRFDGFWEFNLNPWDTAAGVLIVAEAGGRVTKFDDSPFDLQSQETMATNGLIHQELLREFEQIFAGRDLEELPSPVEYAKAARSEK